MKDQTKFYSKASAVLKKAQYLGVVMDGAVSGAALGTVVGIVVAIVATSFLSKKIYEKNKDGKSIVDQFKDTVWGLANGCSTSECPSD